MKSTLQTVLVTGATGYIGGRLVPRLLESGFRVRCLARDPARLEGRSWLGQVEVSAGDCLRAETLPGAMQGVEAAFYLVHSMAGGHDFEQRDVLAARNFAGAAKQAGVRRILYLGGLGDPDTALSEHLRSRQETGAVLREASVPVTEFRAPVIVGSGSLSFEIIRYLTERLPVMICPRWLYTRVQPIAIGNVLDYLVAALDTPESTGRIIEIGGADVLTYGDLLRGYAKARGLRRWLVPVPVLTPRLSSYWVHLVTPVPAAIASPLIQGLRNDVVVRDNLARELFPNITPLDYGTAVRLALANLETGRVETAWSDALASSQGDVAPVVLATQEGIILERRQRLVRASAAVVYGAFTRLGGETGWLCMNWAWVLRGCLDRLLGGVGLRRGRRDPQDVRAGDAVDFWRVEAVEPDRLLRLRAEMKVPGRAWLEFQVEPVDARTSRLSQTAFFAPRGLAGLLYWYLLYPVHAVIFSGMARALACRSERTAASDSSTRSTVARRSS
ncbi:MAG: SDR family oxidoreductase [Verrucomicrobia bacterium]|nr:SDR family oxidoreductase [Verrucomicrobiota bacterium]